MLTINNKVVVFVILSVIVLFHVISNFMWLKQDNTYLIYDSYHHFMFSLGVFEQIKQNLIPFLSEILNSVGVHHRWHGIFVEYITAPFYFIFGSSQDAAVMISSTIFLTLLIFSTYGIGKIMLNKKAGLISAFVVSMYPMVFNHLKIYMLDLPLTAMVSLSMYFLIKSGSLTNRFYSLCFAIASGLGMLIKFNFVGFILGPFLWTLFNIASSGRITKKTVKSIIFNVTLASCLILILVFPFLKLKFWEVFARFYESSWMNPVHFASFKSPFLLMRYWLLLTAKYLLWMMLEIVNNALSFLFFILFVISLSPFCKNKGNFKILLLLWILLPIALLSFFFHYPNIDRYLMPVLPAISIVSGIGITGIKDNIWRRIIMLLVVPLGFLQYFIISYNPGLLPLNKKLELPINILVNDEGYPAGKIIFLNKDLRLEFRNSYNELSLPARVDWPIEKMLNKIMNYAKKAGCRINVFFVDDVVQVYEPMFCKKISYRCIYDSS